MIRAALKSPYLIIVSVLMVAVVGVVSVARIPADLLPTFKTSAVQIVTFYPGMPPEVMEQDIMSRLQRWTGQSAGIEHQEARAMQGVCIVKDFFQEDVESSEALAQVSMYAMSDMFYLPPGTIPPMVMPFDPTASVPLCLVTVSNPNMEEAELYDVAYKNLRNNLQSISGVIAPAVFGGKLRRILAYVDPDKLAAYNLTILDVHQALRDQNVLIPAGSAQLGKTEFYIVTNAIPEQVEELNRAPILVRQNEDPVLFSDIGRVEDTAQIQTNKVRVNGRTLVYVPVYRQPGSNTIEIVDRVHTELGRILERLKDENRDNEAMQSLRLNVVMDQSVKVRESINALWVAGILGALFAGGIVYVFLRNWRTTAIIVMAIPVAILCSFIGLYFSGNTINAMTLGGLALAVGILIDQAIVVIDNIERHRAMGSGRLQSAWDGTREVAIPLFVSTMTFIVVFFPVLFLTGLAKFLFAPLALAVLFAVLASYLIAVFFVPVASAKLLGPNKIKPAESSNSAHGGVDPEQLNWLVGGYRRLLIKSLKMKWGIVLTSAALFIGAVWLMGNTGRELFPPVDAGQFTIYIRAKSGTKLGETEKIVKRIENAVVTQVGDPAPDNPDATYPVTLKRYDTNQNGKMDPEEVEQAQSDSHCDILISNIGVLMDWPAAYTPNAGAMDAFMLVQMADKPDDRSVFDHVTALREKLNAEFPDVEFAFDTGGILTAAMNMGEPSPIHLQITGYSLDTAHMIADEVVQTIESVDGTADVRVAQRNDYPMIQVEIDRVKALSLGITPNEVMKCLVSSTNSSINFDPAFWISPKNGNHYFLGAQYFEEDIKSMDTLRKIPVKRSSVSGRMVYMEDICTFDDTKTGPSVINHRNIKRTTDIYANVEPGYDLGGVMAQIERKLSDSDHPLRLAPITDPRSAIARYPQWMQTLLGLVGVNNPTKFAINGQLEGKPISGFTFDIQGEIRSMRDSFVDFAIGLALAAVLVYLVMVAQFRSFLDPIIVMVTVPLGFIGVALILYLTNTRLNIQSFMGIIMMIGIVVEYTIVLMDFANHRLREGAEVEQAIVDAAIVRFRPILMTSVTTILALLPMAIGFAGGEADVPLARTIVGAVIAATLLPKFVVPCLYVLMKRKPAAETEVEPGWV